MEWSCICIESEREPMERERFIQFELTLGLGRLNLQVNTNFYIKPWKIIFLMHQNYNRFQGFDFLEVKGRECNTTNKWLPLVNICEDG